MVKQVAWSTNSETRRARRNVAVAGGAAALVLAWGGAAWACSPAAAMSRTNLGAGAEDSTVIVAGSNFTSDVQILWATDTSALATAAVLGTAHGPSFSVRITIPEASPGLYYVVAVGRDNFGVQGMAASTFDLLPTAGRASPSTEPTATPEPDLSSPSPTTPVPAVKDQPPGRPAPTPGSGPLAPSRPSAHVVPRTPTGPTSAVVTAPSPAPLGVSGATSRPTEGAPPTAGAAADPIKPELVSLPPSPNPWAFDPSRPASSGLLSAAGDSAPRNGRAEALGLGLLVAGGSAAVAAVAVLATSRSRQIRRALVRRR